MMRPSLRKRTGRTWTGCTTFIVCRAWTATRLTRRAYLPLSRAGSDDAQQALRRGTCHHHQPVTHRDRAPMPFAIVFFWRAWALVSQDSVNRT